MSKHNLPHGLLHFLCLDGLLTNKTAQEVQAAINGQTLTVPQYLVQQALLTSAAILACCQRHLTVPTCELDASALNLLTSAPLNHALMHRYRVIPIDYDDHYLCLGMSDPTDTATIDAIRFHTGLAIRPMLTDENALEHALTHHFSVNTINNHLQTALEVIPPSTVQPSLTTTATDNDDEPITQFVNQVIKQAIAQHASDIHVEPLQQQSRIRFRCDGMLHEVTQIPSTLALRVIARFKIMADLNIAEKRHPQDGRLTDPALGNVSLRISTCPTLYGEKVQCRLIHNKQQLNLEALGLLQTQYDAVINALAKPQGLILVTGPTGSGKSLTLHAALQHLNDTARNICTLEDPIEATVAGVNHVAINHGIGLDFATLMRTLLRQDPDVIMIGEIRDPESAHIALQAAQTGHLVLATLHSNHALAALSRLHMMGLAQDLFCNTISLIAAQRLVRQLCAYCKTPDHQHHENGSTRFTSVGCRHCRNGFKGRVGIFECLPFTHTLLSQLQHNHLTPLPADDFPQSYITLWESGLAKVNAGITSFQELSRVVARENSSCHA